MNALPTRAYAAFLFDMDGTILDSIASAERAWDAWSRANGHDPAAVRATMHGVRTVETMRRWGAADPEAAAHALMQAEMADVGDVVPIAGAPAFLAAIPADRWALVTSAPRVLAERRLAAAGLTPPAIFVSAEDVTRGKPAPDPFLMGAQRLGVAAADCLVFEDAPAGIAAGLAAGADVVAITATHREPLAAQVPMVRDYRALTVMVAAHGLVLSPRD